MSALIIESRRPYEIEEAVYNKGITRETCNKCPVFSECTPIQDLKIRYQGLLDSLLLYPREFDLTVVGYKAGEVDCPLMRDEFPVEFKKVELGSR